MSYMIKIISGYTNPGGATTALINLTNELNKNNLYTTMYGPHDWFVNQCNGKVISNELTFNKDDVLLFHYIKQNKRPNAKKVLLLSHEKWWFPVGKISQYWDSAVFLHDQHRAYHSDYDGDYHIIPNLREPLNNTKKTELDKTAGVIGAIEHRKQTHVSIQRALNDGCDRVYLFGVIQDKNYHDSYVKPLLSENVVYKGFTNNKQQMYDTIGRVYHSSKGEVACLVKDECVMTGTKFFGNEETTNEVFEGTNQDIIEMWKEILNV